MGYLTSESEALDDATVRALLAYFRPDDYPINTAAEARAKLLERLDEVTTNALSDLERLWDKGRGYDTTPTTLSHQGTLVELLHFLAALRAALRMGISPNGAEYLAALRAADTTTPAGDVLRLHILSEHRNAAALNLTDRQATDYHHHEHNGPGGIRNHPYEGTHWTVARAKETLAGPAAEQAEDGFDPADVWAPFHETVGRVYIAHEERDRG